MGSKTVWLPFVLALGCGATAFAANVIIIGVDGLSVDGVETANTPRLHALMDRAAWTLEARDVMPTLSSPNWASAINGAGPEQHGITSNGYIRRMVAFRPVCQSEDGKFPTIFWLLRQARPHSKIALFLDWGGFAKLLEEDVPDVARHVSGAANTTAAAIAYWRQNRPALMFIHLDNVDHAGHTHRHGWLSKQYYAAVEEADGYIGQVLDMVDALHARGSTYILVTSDHGGTAHGHGKNSLAEIQIPWILAGPGVTPGRIHYPVNIYDTALTVAWIFHLDPPSCWIGRPVLPAFSPALVAANASGARAPVDCAPDRQVTRAILTTPVTHAGQIN